MEINRSRNPIFFIIRRNANLHHNPGWDLFHHVPRHFSTHWMWETNITINASLGRCILQLNYKDKWSRWDSEQGCRNKRWKRKRVEGEESQCSVLEEVIQRYFAAFLCDPYSFLDSFRLQCLHKPYLNVDLHACHQSKARSMAITIVCWILVLGHNFIDCLCLGLRSPRKQTEVEMSM